MYTFQPRRRNPYGVPIRGRGKNSGTLRSHNQARGLKRGRGSHTNSRSSEPADIRKSHDNVTSRVLSASRNRINELRNKVEELNIQIRELQQENKLYKKMQFRQEKAIRVIEDKENDLPSILDRHNNEVRVLREQNKRLKDKYEKSDRYLRDAEDELEKMKIKLKKYKDMCEQQELKEREELSRQLGQAQLDLEEREVKLKELQRHIDMLKKNHRHELGIEVARQKEMKKQVEELTEKNTLLENQLKEKEKALDYLNIYSNPQQGRPSRDSSPDGSTMALRSKKKTSTVPELTPRDKAKFYSEKRRLELFKQKELKEEKERKKKEQWEKEERDKEKDTLSSSQQFVFGNTGKIFDESEEDRLEGEKRHRQDRENRERRDEELMKKQRELEKRQEHEHQDRMARENRKEREERGKIEQHERESRKLEEKERREHHEREEKARKEAEKREQRERERQQEQERKMERERQETLEEERRQREKVEQERRIQMEKENLESDPFWQAERKKKDELLKKMQQTDKQRGVDADPFMPLASKKSEDNHFHSIGIKDTSESPSRKGETKEYSFTQPINNLHRGKPAHEDVTVPYLERQKQRRRTSDDSAGYEPSFGPAKGEGNKAPKTKPAPSFDVDEPMFKLPANTTSSTATKQQDKKPTNLLETLFGPQASNPERTSTKAAKENDPSLSRAFSHTSTSQNKAADTTSSPYHHPNPQTNKSRLDFDKKATIFGGGTLIEDEFPSNNSKILPRRHRESNLNTFSAKPSVTAIDTFDDEIEEVVL
ncbi:hypothetical protein BsWGS_28305 [Bradybaena similaris]